MGIMKSTDGRDLRLAPRRAQPPDLEILADRVAQAGVSRLYSAHTGRVVRHELNIRSQAMEKNRIVCTLGERRLRSPHGG